MLYFIIFLFKSIDCGLKACEWVAILSQHVDWLDFRMRFLAAPRKSPWYITKRCAVMHRVYGYIRTVNWSYTASRRTHLKFRVTQFQTFTVHETLRLVTWHAFQYRSWKVEHWTNLKAQCFLWILLDDILLPALTSWLKRFIKWLKRFSCNCYCSIINRNECPYTT